MHEYDVTLKLLLQQSEMFLRDLTVVPVAEWLNVELPKVENRRVDLLLRTVDDELLHIEFQSRNDATMALRMAEYALAIYRRLGKFPRQVLIYVGREAMKMANTLSGPFRSYSYELVDMREVSGERLLESRAVGDNIVAILGKLTDPRDALHRLLLRIRELPIEQRGRAYECALLLADLRGLSSRLEKEEESMPITEDLWDHEVIGRERRQAQVNLLRRQITKRFGPPPTWVEEELAKRNHIQLEDLGERLMDVASLAELFR